MKLSTVQLCVEHKVSRATIRRALDLLEEEGLVERRQGARTYAKALGYKVSLQRQNLDLFARGEKGYLDLLRDNGNDLAADVLFPTAAVA